MNIKKKKDKIKITFKNIYIKEFMNQNKYTSYWTNKFV